MHKLKTLKPRLFFGVRTFSVLPSRFIERKGLHHFNRSLVWWLIRWRLDVERTARLWILTFLRWGVASTTLKRLPPERSVDAVRGHELVDRSRNLEFGVMLKVAARQKQHRILFDAEVP